MLFQTSIPWLSERPVLASMRLYISVARYSSQPVAFRARHPESEAKEKNSGTISELGRVVSERSHCRIYGSNYLHNIKLKHAI